MHATARAVAHTRSASTISGDRLEQLDRGGDDPDKVADAIFDRIAGRAT